MGLQEETNLKTKQDRSKHQDKAKKSLDKDNTTHGKTINTRQHNSTTNKAKSHDKEKQGQDKPDPRPTSQKVGIG